MFNIEKLEKMLENQQNSEEFKSKFQVREIKLVKIGEPKPYARERYTRFGKNGKGRFYNKRAVYMQELKEEFQQQRSEDDINLINALIEHKDEYPYYVEVSGKFYVGIPKSDSLKTAYLKASNALRPTNNRGDADNYIKLVLDSLHDVLYEDDKHVIKIASEKFYSLEPRMELTAKIYFLNEAIQNEEESN